jgi:CMP/dCMP kinase
MGSLGCEVAQEVAALLGYRAVWRDIINQAARRAGVPRLALHAIDELGLFGIKPTRAENDAYQDALRQVVTELADQGKMVIVGRAGQAILHGRADAIHVRVIAPIELRAERLMRDQNISADAAMAQIKTSDRSRKTFLRRSYGVDWDSPDLYDLVINTARIETRDAAALIAELVTRIETGKNNP